MPRPRSVSDEQIIAATITAIGKHGPAKLTLAHVADEVGLTPAALVQRFGSKARLLAAVADDAGNYAEAAFAEAEADNESPVDAIREAMAGFAGDINSRTELANHMAMLQLDLTEPHLRERAAAQSRLVRDRIRSLVDRGVANGELRCEDAAALADTVYAAYAGAMLMWAIDGRGALHDWIRTRVDAALAPYET